MRTINDKPLRIKFPPRDKKLKDPIQQDKLTANYFRILRKLQQESTKK